MKSDKIQKIPFLARFILKRMSTSYEKHSILEDFEETYNDILVTEGLLKADFWCWLSVSRSLMGYLKLNIFGSLAMFRNYLKITFRNIKRQKGYSFINIAGLAIGLASCILIVSYILFELSFDKYHKNAHRIYRLAVDLNIGGHETQLAITDAPAAPALQKDYPEVLSTVRFFPLPKAPIRYENKQFFEERVIFADNSVFNVFSFPMIIGDPDRALETAYSVVLTEEMAGKYFAGDDPVGKILTFNNKDNYTVTGIIKNVPENSHFTFDMLCSFQTLYNINKRRMNVWLNMDFYTYILLPENYDYRELESKFPAFIDKYMGKFIKSAGGTLEYFLQPLTSIHLHSNMEAELTGNGDITVVYIFMAIAVFILLIACINYMNLATARSSTRAGEIAMRKILGSDRRKLIKQFLGESLLYSLFSLGIAFILATLTIPAFRSITGKELNIQFPLLIPGFLLIALFVGVIAGSYPAFVLSSFRPLRVLKGFLKAGPAHSQFRNTLVVVQFVISITLLIGTGIIFNQLNYMKNKRLGFNKEHVVVLPIMDNRIAQSLELIKEGLISFKGIKSIGAASHIPGERPASHAFIPEGFSENQTQLMMDMNCDDDLITTLGMEIIAGRNFSEEYSSDNNGSIIINETAAKKYGWDEPVGKTIQALKGPDAGNMVKRTVVGVVKDFHMISMHRIIEPLYIRNESGYFNYLFIRTGPGNIAGTMDFIRKKWKEIDPDRPFEYLFLDETFNRQYKADERVREIFTYFTFFSILIACLGLFGLASFTASQRTKEIGIRKVLGASVAGIVIHISKDFIKWVILANIIAWPAAYFAINSWLQNFAYRTDISILLFIFAGILTLMIALITISFQAIKAARANPVIALKYE